MRLQSQWKIVDESSIRRRYGESLAPESCGLYREVQAEALTWETDRPAIEPRFQESGMPTLLSEAEGNMMRSANRKLCVDPTRSETLRMPGSLSHGSSEISSMSGAVWSDGAGKGSVRGRQVTGIPTVTATSHLPDAINLVHSS